MGSVIFENPNEPRQPAKGVYCWSYAVQGKEIPFYIGPVARVPYLLPGSRDLAEAVTAAMRDHDMVVMGNHGQVTVARDLEHVIQNAEFFELACGIIVRGGPAVTPLSDEMAAELLALRQGLPDSGVS